MRGTHPSLDVNIEWWMGLSHECQQQLQTLKFPYKEITYHYAKQIIQQANLTINDNLNSNYHHGFIGL